MHYAYYLRALDVTITHDLTRLAVGCEVLVVVKQKIVFAEGVFLEKSKSCLNNLIHWLARPNNATFTPFETQLPVADIVFIDIEGVIFNEAVKASYGNSSILMQVKTSRL